MKIKMKIKMFGVGLLVSISGLILLSGCSSLNMGSSGISSKAPSFKPYKEKRLSNGLRLIVIPDRTLPRFSIGLMVFTGLVNDPKSKEGLNSLTAQVLSKGTKSKSAIEMADAFGDLGTSFSQQAGDEHSFFSSSSLSFHKEKLFDLFYETLMSPVFAKSEIRRLKKQMINQIERRSDNPSAFASVSFKRFVYGKHSAGNPFNGSIKSVKRLNKQDVTGHYLRYYRPNNAVMYITGDFSPSFLKRVERKMALWKSRDLPALNLSSPVIKKEGLKIRLVHKKGLKQAQIRMGHLSVKRRDRDFFPLKMSSTILGGGFSSRLNQKIRDDLGLTYSVYSSLRAKRQWGSLSISTFTRNEKTGQTISEILSLYKKIANKGVLSKELKDNKALMIGRFPRQMETADDLAFNLLMLRLYNVTDSYLHNYLRNVNNLSLSKVNRVIRKNFRPNDMRILVYGDAFKVLRQLKKIGDVEVVSYKRSLL